jgi:hypothetical protein
MATKSRLDAMEEMIRQQNERLGQVECKISKLDEIIAVVSKKQADLELSLEAKYKEMLQYTDSKVAVSEIKYEDKLESIKSSIQELSDKSIATELIIAEFKADWPTPSESEELVRACKSKAQVVESKAISVKNSGVSKVSFSEKYRNCSKETVLLVGDSLARGVGRCLEIDSHLFKASSFSGAKIEDISEGLSKLGDKPDSQVVLMVGTNNLQKDGSEVMIQKYEKLIKQAQRNRFKKISLVSILRRDDISEFTNSRRLGLNLRLKDICEKEGVDFIDHDLVTEHLGRDRIHLSRLGQDEIARIIFRRCKKHLNL